MLNQPHPFHSALRLQDLSVQAHLGWTAEERELAQEVRLTAEIRFRERPMAADSDDLAGTVDYGELAKRLREACMEREYRLIEKMGAVCLDVVREHAPHGAHVAVKVQKMRPPVESLLGGAVFSCGDFHLQ